VAKKTDKALNELAKELKKLRKENEKLAKSLEKSREDQIELHEKVLALLEERLPVGAASDETEDHEENGGFVTADGDVPEASAEARQDHEEAPEVTDAAKRRAEELGVDPSDVEAAAGR
jgi:hypothetical protein